MSLPTIVLATDDLIEQVQLEEILSVAFDVILANDPEELVSFVEGRLPELVFVSADFSTPGGGLLLCRHLKAMPRTRPIPVLAICNRDTQLDLRNVERGQPDEIILRPIHIPELQIRLNSIWRMQRYAAEIVQGSRVDPLTSAYTRGYLLERLSYEIKRAQRYGRSLALTLVDLDGFSALNNDKGVAVGDLVLREVSRVLSSQVRGVDLLARSGDDEFCVIFPETSLLVARPIAERLCKAVRDMVFTAPDSTELKVAISAGVVGVPHPDMREVPDMLRCARTALQRARESGGNKAVLY